MWNAKNDLVNQLRNDQACSSAAKVWAYDVVTYGGGGIFTRRTNGQAFVVYIQKTWHFYDGTKSTFDATELGANGTNLPMTVAQRWFGQGSTTTAVTATPHDPLEIFWQPADATKSAQQVGIDPSGYGVNLLNESHLFHEALHGYTGLFDPDIQGLLHAKDSTVTVNPSNSSNRTAYISQHVLGQCPISTR